MPRISRIRYFPWTGILLLCLILALWAGESNATPAKKVEITAETADIHLDPDIKSPVIETLNKGMLLTRDSPRTFKREWCYVYFTSEESGAVKSGYIHTSKIRKLFRTTRILTIR